MHEIERPRFLTIRQVAKFGILTEYALRLMVKQGKIPHIQTGNKTLINYDLFLEQVNNAGSMFYQ